MRNKHPGICYRCGGFVGVGEGHFERVSRVHFKKWPGFSHASRWLIQHAECADRYYKTDVHYIHNPVKEGGN